MATIKGYVTGVTGETTKGGDEYRILLLTKTADPDDTQITKVYDWDDLGGGIPKSTWQHLEIDERPAPNGGLFRSLKGILDAPPSNAPPPPQEPPPEPQEGRSAPPPAPAASSFSAVTIDGLIWGAVAHDAAALLGPNLPKPEPFDSDGDGRGNAGVVWPDDEWSAMAALCQDKLTRMLYEQRPR